MITIVYSNNIWLGIMAKLIILQCIRSDDIECVSGWWVTSAI